MEPEGEGDVQEEGEEVEKEGEEEEDDSDNESTKTDKDSDLDYHVKEEAEPPQADNADLPLTLSLSPFIGGRTSGANMSNHLKEEEIPTKEVMPKPSGEAKPLRKKLTIKLYGATTSTCLVQAPPAPDVGILSPGFDVEMFSELSSLPLPDYVTMIVIGNYSLAMTSGEFNFDEYSSLRGHYDTCTHIHHMHCVSINLPK